MTIRRAYRWLRNAVMVLVLWSLVVLALPFFGPAGRLTAVLGSTSDAINAVREAGGSVVGIRAGVVLARSGERDFAWRLYTSGAGLVVEGRIAAGCLALVS